MPDQERNALLIRMEETRKEIESLLPGIDPAQEIYPGWTIKEMLAHMTGWDDATIDSIRAHYIGCPPSVDAIRSLDEYNDLTVASRQNLSYDQVVKEWRLTRQVLQALIEHLPDEKFIEPLVVPWGETATVTALVEIFRGHEEFHIREMKTWLQNPDRPLEKHGD